MMTYCKHLKTDYRNPPHCTKLKVDNPNRKRLCKNCMFRDKGEEQDDRG